jgi:hypothetical protein
MSIPTVECTVCKTKNSIDKQINEIVCISCDHAISPWDTNNKNWSNILAIDILKREKLKLPYTQHLVRNKIDSENNLPQVSLINTEVGNIYRKSRELKSAIYQIRRSGTLNTDENKSTFVKPCVVDGCRGFLSSQWKCGVCSTWVCSKCHQVKNRKDDDEHVCNEDDVKTAELIQSSTKNCPKCSVGITKIDGCDQMFCVECHTAFSWRSGKIVHGAIHNPHFFEWQRNGGQAPPRNPMDIPCGGLVDRYDIDRVHPVRSNSPYNLYLTKVSELTHHIQNVELDRYPADRVRPEDNEKHRVNYLLKDISEDKWRQLLKNQNKKRLKNHAVNQVLYMYMMTTNDLLRNTLEYNSSGIIDVDVVVKIENIIRELEKLRIYTNDNLDKIEKRFKNVTPHIYDSYSCYPGRDKVELPITINDL